MSLLPPANSCQKFYLRPKAKMSPSTWYCDQPYGNKRIGTTIKELCKNAGFSGKFTNHSLRATSATHEDDIPEQIIKEVTGHKSEAVRFYKRTNDSMRQHASKVVSGGGSESKKIKVDESESSYDEKQKERIAESLSACNIIRLLSKPDLKCKRNKVVKVHN